MQTYTGLLVLISALILAMIGLIVAVVVLSVKMARVQFELEVHRTLAMRIDPKAYAQATLEHSREVGQHQLPIAIQRIALNCIMFLFVGSVAVRSLLSHSRWGWIGRTLDRLIYKHAHEN